MSSSNTTKNFNSIITPLFFLLPIGFNIAISYGTVRNISITVSEKERVANRDTSQYLVWTEENGVFKVKDSLLQGKFRASDTYGKLKAGKTYKVRVNGIRFGITSSYPNILDITQISK